MNDLHVDFIGNLNCYHKCIILLVHLTLRLMMMSE